MEKEVSINLKRSAAKLQLKINLLIKVELNKNPVPVVSFPLIVEIMHNIHIQAAHIDKHKLIDLITVHFYHPAIETVAYDIYSSYCLLYKIGSQTEAPPVLKSQASYPYDLVAMDLLQFSKSSDGNVAILVAIDHFSTFLFTVPIKNKKADTVSKIANENILPKMLRIPDRILTDNGPEFRSTEFNNMLQELNTSHIYSTSYKASSNGAVERSNRTIMDLLKGLVTANPAKWDTDLGKMIILYNNTLHSQLSTTPSKYILQNSFH